MKVPPDMEESMQSVDSQSALTGELNSQKFPSAARQVMGLIRSLVVCYLLIGLLMWSPLYQAVVLRPFGPDEHYDAVRKIPTCKEYFIPNAHGDKLHAWFFRIPAAKKLVIVHHGNAGNIIHRLYLANAAIMCGAAVLLYDYRGYGLSTGKPSLAGLSEDGSAVYDFATGPLGFAANQIVNFGESIGTGVACRLASTKPSAGLILQSPVASLPAVARAGVFVFRAYPDIAFPQPHFDNLSEIARV